MGDPTTTDSNALTLSFPDANALTNLPPGAEFAVVRQMVETLFARVETLQQHQAIQLAGVHDRLDAVELQIPMIQEQSALRIRDLEARMSAEIEEIGAGLQTEVTGRFSSLAAQMEAQREELGQIRESKRLAETRLDRAILDIERLCANLGAPSREEPAKSTLTPIHSRISEHIRKAALDLAPGVDNPLVADPQLKKPRKPLEESIERAVARPPSPAHAANGIPDFEAWKRRFMEEDEPPFPALTAEAVKPSSIVVCPRCFSDRTRPATANHWDRLFRLAGFTPHRCKSCAHRFYKRESPASSAPDNGQPPARTPNAMETR
jgi:hypothetical protein